MRFSDFIAETPEFTLCGGPFDGKKVDARIYSAWPQTIKMARVDSASLAIYEMRIGSLEHYDYCGDHHA